ncbi:hypothetical protein M7I_2205 [Glarea lozoyensis 74030]|uniref:Uncharacterized protein n=1 Tax=Glarea lozoyensis (strain ATCC 74030 / MF5533) TaxID=1104152 RepID=H0EI55_GLAL7|nr:hypothetical protein M7I_2205 [Glarea lozoyensis 74030]
MVRIYLSPVDKVNKPPLRYLQVQDALVLGSGIPWTIACANIAWELIYGVIHPNSLGQVISFVPWLIADVPIVYATERNIWSFVGYLGL